MNRTYTSWTLALRRTLLVCLTPLAACTEPTAPGEEPSYLQLERRVFLTEPGRELNPFLYKCPSVTARTGPITRKRVPGSTATMAFPVEARVTQAGFRALPGGVFSVGALGLIAVSYDDLFATDLVSGNLFRRLPSSPAYGRWCATTIAGQPAVFHVDTDLGIDLQSEVPFQYFNNDIALIVTEPSGRRMNIRLIGEPRNLFVILEHLQVAPLLQIAASVEW